MLIRITLLVSALALFSFPDYALGQLSFSFSDAVVDEVTGTARINVNAVLSDELIANAALVPDIGQYTTTIGVEFSGALMGETVGLTARNLAPLAAPFFFTPGNGEASVSNGQSLTFTVGSFGATTFASLLTDPEEATIPLLALDFAVAEWLESASPSAVTVSVQDVGSPGQTSMGKIGSLDPPFVDDPLYAVTPSGGSLETPTFGPTATLVLVSASLSGDFNEDGAWSAEDIDILSQAVRDQDQRPMFDLNLDGSVSGDDRATWVEDFVMTTWGDVDLDQDVDFADFLAFSAHFGQPGGWASGDFDGDGFALFADFLALSSNFGTTRVVAVPEGNLASSLLAVLFALVMGKECSKNKCLVLELGRVGSRSLGDTDPPPPTT